ncbi:hypothetical protein [Streptomyces sp. NPDC001135]
MRHDELTVQYEDPTKGGGRGCDVPPDLREQEAAEIRARCDAG